MAPLVPVVQLPRGTTVELNRDAYVEQRADSARLYATIQTRLWQTLGVSVRAVNNALQRARGKLVGRLAA